MKVYQKKNNEVKASVKIIDAEALSAKASEGLLHLSMELGLEIMQQLLEAEVKEHVGVKGKHATSRTAYRHGSERTKVVLGGQKVSTQRPRIRSTDGQGEIPLETLSSFQREDPLNQAILTRLLLGVSCRKYARTLEEGEEAHCVSKSEVSRRFIQGMKEAMTEFFGRKLEGSYPVIWIDGTELGKMTIVAAMGLRTDGEKQMLGFIEGGSENAEVVKSLLSDLLERGLDHQEKRLFIVDGSKALAKAVKDTFGDRAMVQRCQVHKKRNVLAHIPESEKAEVSRQMSAAYQEFDFKEALRKLERLHMRLEAKYPAAAASLREGMEETLTVHRLGIPGLLRQTLSNTNALESANSVCAGILRRVTHFKNGETALRQAAAGFLEAERSFRRIKGYKQMPVLTNALLALTNPDSTLTMDIA